jgi:hypothetical protein
MRRNPDDKQTLPVPDPEKNLKSRRYLKKTVSSTNRFYQPKTVESNTSDLFEGSNTPSYHGGLPTNKITTFEPGLVLPDFKTEIFPIVSFTNKGKRSASLPAPIDTSSLCEVHLSISWNSYDHPILLETNSDDSPLYSPYESEETSPLFPSSPSSSFLYIDNQFCNVPKAEPYCKSCL